MTRDLLVGLLCALALSGCERTLTAEEKAQLIELRAELEATNRELSQAELESTKYGGGLLGSLILVRKEILKTNAALIQQRIHAVESGATVQVETLGTTADPDRATQLKEQLSKQELVLSKAEAKASGYSGGLVGAMAMMSAATESNSLALLRQQYLIARFGLAAPQQVAGNRNIPESPNTSALDDSADSTEASTDSNLREGVLDVSLLRKQFKKQDYQDYVFFDVAFTAKGLDRSARAIKGALILTDLFGEQKFAIGWTIDKSVAPGATYTEKGSGFEYNQFVDSHRWVRSTDRNNMKAKFRVDNILYEDGSTRSFDEP